MKFLFFLFVIFSFGIHAQDTIHFRNGEVKAVKVTEVGTDNVKFNRFSNAGGPLYTVAKNDIQYIKYSNGFKDSFAITVAEIIPAEKINSQHSEAQREPGKIMVTPKGLYLNGEPVGENKLYWLINDLPQSEKRNRLLKSYHEMKLYKKQQYIIGFSALGVGVASPVVGLYAWLLSYPDQNENYFLGGVVTGAAVGIIGGAISSYCKKKRTEKKLELTRIYNE